MPKYATGKHAKAISDRSGLEFPYREMVREWNGSFVHVSEFEPKQPQLEPRPSAADAISLRNVRPDRIETAVPNILPLDPFTTASGSATITVEEPDDGRSTNDPASVFGISDILEAQLRSNRTQTTQSDSPMTKVDRSTYAGFSNKLSKGTPNQYWVERFIDKVTIHIYPTPDSTNASKDMHFFFIKRIQDVGDYTNATDVPFRFVPCMVSGLAYYLAQKYQPNLIQPMKLVYEDELARALAEDGSASSTHITPKAYYPGT